MRGGIVSSHLPKAKPSVELSKWEGDLFSSENRLDIPDRREIIRVLVFGVAQLAGGKPTVASSRSYAGSP